MFKRGAFLVFEGVDRCGKTTQTKLLVEKLKQEGRQVELMRFPDRTTTVGKMIDQYLKMGINLHDKAIHLLFSANRWELASKIESLLQKGVTIVCDRYSFSGVAFSGAKDGMDMDWLKRPEEGLPAPDRVIYLDIDVESSKARGGFGQERYEKEEMQKVVRKNFQAMKTKSWTIIDAKQSIEKLAEQIHEIAKHSIEEASKKPLGKLWKY